LRRSKGLSLIRPANSELANYCKDMPPKGGRLRGKKADGESTGGPAGSLIKVKDLRAADRRFQQIPVVTLEVRILSTPPRNRPG
jgi:hypothetical protein